MKKNNVLLVLLAVVLAACALLLPDGQTYLVAALMVLAVLGTMWANRSAMLKLTRWAKANPRQAQWFIAMVQLALMGLCILAGYNLKELGFTFSDSTAYVFSVLMVLGFVAVPFRPRRSTIVLPADLNRHRLAYLAIIISSVVTTAFFGNRVGDLYPDLLISKALKTVDQTIFSDNTLAYFGYEEASDGLYSRSLAGGSTASTVLASLKISKDGNVEQSLVPEQGLSKKALKKANKVKKKAERKAKRDTRKEFRKKLRLFFAAGSCGLAIFLIVLLVIPLCAGICLIAFGIAGEAGASAAIGLVLLGLVLTAGSIWGMISLAKWCKRGGGS